MVKNSPRGAGMNVKEDSIQVMIRCRPFSKREMAWFEANNKEVTSMLHFDGQKVTVLDPENSYQPKDAFTYNQCFWSTTGYDSPNGFATQEDVYEATGKVLLKSALEGYNGCVFAYGQTGSGKTYSMLGGPGSPGVSYLFIRDLFAHIEQEKIDNPDTKYSVEISFMEIYNEQVRDLFNKKAKAGEYSPVKIRQHPVHGIQIEGLIRSKVENALQCEEQMEKGVSERALAETKMNATSSRSHAICQICIETKNDKKGINKTSLINLVDLAGSERLKMTGAAGAQLTEAKNINQSLSTLRKVFDVLIENAKKKQKNVPPYRESMLTWVLKESLGGNSRTMMIAAVSPCEENMEDTVSTLRYAQKAKAIVCKVIQNEQATPKLLNNLKGQLADLQAELEQARSSNTRHVPDAMIEEYEEEKKAMSQRIAECELMVKTSRENKFADAFRRAFVKENYKIQIAEQKKDLLLAKVAATQSQEAHAQAQEECESARKLVEEYKAVIDEVKEQNNALQRKVNECRCVQLRDKVKYCTDAINAKEQECRVEIQYRQRAEDDLTRLKVRHKEDYSILDQKVKLLTARLEEMTLSRDKYKKEALLLSNQNETSTRIIAAMKDASSPHSEKFASPGRFSRLSSRSPPRTVDLTDSPIFNSVRYSSASPETNGKPFQTELRQPSRSPTEIAAASLAPASRSTRTRFGE
eukprot:TRINITY_DN14756_c0_g1_i3.p1 TRINITY_DN14756_c0_g1~~TRINITY_DN14756_c0_g1_i3.p1  ORF type:complete len:709 (+),score=168.85 TRINITY_DN14756_c0_g1_i3:42-2129(+)